MDLVKSFSQSETGAGNNLGFFCCSVSFFFFFLSLQTLLSFHLDTGRKLNVYKIFRRRPIYVLCPGVMPESSLMCFDQSWKGRRARQMPTFFKKVDSSYVYLNAIMSQFQIFLEKWKNIFVLLNRAGLSPPVGIYLPKVNNRNTRTRCQIYSKLTMKTPTITNY